MLAGVVFPKGLSSACRWLASHCVWEQREEVEVVNTFGCSAMLGCAPVGNGSPVLLHLQGAVGGIRIFL